jgi:hypothetical protein
LLLNLCVDFDFPHHRNPTTQMSFQMQQPNFFLPTSLPVRLLACAERNLSSFC